MGVKSLAVLSGISLMAAGVLGAATSAEAAVLFNQGDTLTITGDVDFKDGAIKIPGIGGSFFQFFDTSGKKNPNFGNFEVNPTSTGVFSQYISGSADADYKIKSFDIGSAADVTPLALSADCSNPALNFLCTNSIAPGQALKLNVPFVTLDKDLADVADPDITITLDAITKFFTDSSGITGQLSTFVAGNVSFFADNKAIGTGSFNASFKQGKTATTFSGDFTVDEVIVPSVPEPTTVLGLLAFGTLAAGATKRKRNA